jgi:hypothetical protein
LDNPSLGPKLHCPALCTNDLREVGKSVFGRWHVISIEYVFRFLTKGGGGSQHSNEVTTDDLGLITRLLVAIAYTMSRLMLRGAAAILRKSAEINGSRLQRT